MLATTMLEINKSLINRPAQAHDSASSGVSFERFVEIGTNKNLLTKNADDGVGQDLIELLIISLPVMRPVQTYLNESIAR